MSELWRIVLTASITIAGGIIVYALGHFLVALFVEPIHRLRSLIGEIADFLVFYANVYSNPGYGQKELMDEASEALRRQASQLMARAHSVPCYSFWSLIGLVREKTEIKEASAELIGLSNSIHRSEPNLCIQNHKRREKIEELLGIRGSAEQKESHSINISMLSHGTLLFFFSLVLLGVKERTLVLFGYEIYTYPIWFYVAFGMVALVVSLVFIIAVFWRRLASRLEDFLKEKQRIIWRAVLQYLYFIAFWFVYLIGWLKGLSAISADRFIFDVVFWFGFILFLIIPIVWFKVIFQRKK